MAWSKYLGVEPATVGLPILGGENVVFLIPLYKDLRVLRLVKTPTVIAMFDKYLNICNVDIIYKDIIVCDTCSSPVAEDEEDLEKGMPIGYAVCDEEYIIEVVCEGCRRRYFKDARIFDSLEEAGI